MTKNKGTLVRLSPTDLKMISCAAVKAGSRGVSTWMRSVLLREAAAVMKGVSPSGASPICRDRCALIEPFIGSQWQEFDNPVGEFEGAASRWGEEARPEIAAQGGEEPPLKLNVPLEELKPPLFGVKLNEIFGRTLVRNPGYCFSKEESEAKGAPGYWTTGDGSDEEKSPDIRCNDQRPSPGLDSGLRPDTSKLAASEGYTGQSWLRGTRMMYEIIKGGQRRTTFVPPK